MPRAFLIDTDTASDDAVALLMALRHPDVEVVAVTVVSGNVPVDQGVANALLTVELAGARVPVYRGAAAPLARPAVYAYWFHGRDGLGDMGYPPARSAAAPGEAAEAIVRAARQHPGLTLVTLGPLTNLARALERDPGLPRRVGRCVVMGGAACTVGNVTPAAEFNLFVDPEAAQRVFLSGLPLEMVGWELCRGAANLTETEMAEIRALGTPLADFTLDCNRTAIEANRAQSGDPGMALPDPVAMAIALDPGVCTRRGEHYVQVETASELTRGMTVVDALDVTHDERNAPVWGELRRRPPNVTVCWEIDVAAWKRSLRAALAPAAERVS
ncbi:MAG: nucleoside hydrolase [Thermoanaerobaculia bacterium]|nr:nucleoside hydrolase [Thermoanaerobaculia bacterium]